MNNRQKKIERKREKRKEKVKKIKRNPLSIREQHVEKSGDEREAYINFINLGEPNESTIDIEKEEEDGIKKIEIIGKKKDWKINSTNESSKERKTYNTNELSRKKKTTTWQKLKNSWHRKWADNLVNLFFQLISYIIIAIISYTIAYFFATDPLKKEIQQLKEDLSNKDSEIRKEIVNDIVGEINKKEDDRFEQTQEIYEGILNDLIKNEKQYEIESDIEKVKGN